MATLPELVSELRLTLPLLKVLVPEKYLARDATGRVYTSWEKNWYQRPPAIVRVDGVEQTTGFSLNYRDGSVTFAVAPSANAIVTAEFWFSPFSDEELLIIMIRASRELSTLLTSEVDTEGDLGVFIEEPIMRIAKKKIYDALWGVVADYHKWELDGLTIDKKQVATNFKEIIKQDYEEVKFMVARLRMNDLTDGTTTTGLSISGT